MGQAGTTDWLAEAAGQFDQRTGRRDGARAAACLANGLTVLRDSLYQRVRKDVERVLGADSMLVPVSEIRTHHLATEATEAYQVAESAVAARELGYVSQDDWYLEWLVRLRMSRFGVETETLKRSREYVAMSADQRRLAFGDALARIVPESRQAPLVLFRLMPLSVWVATACAFGDQATARQLRSQQLVILPAIADCRLCEGRLLECVEQCRGCGNPLWKYEWLAVTD